jgi:hypothetical protein
MLYLVSLIYFFFTTLFLVGKLTSQTFLVSESIRTAFSTLSQIMLCFVFWSIHKTSLIEDESYEKDPNTGSIASIGDINYT